MNSPILAGLNSRQLEGVTSIGQRLLVLAGAGSGKTRVLTHRIAWLISEQGVDPREIIAVTFTNKAAREMRERLHRLLEERGKHLLAGTFHSLGMRILRRDGERLGYPPDFTILDTDDQERIIKRRMARDGHDTTESRSVVQWINRQKDAGLSIGQISNMHLGDHPHWYLDLFEAYEEERQNGKLADFADLITKSLQLLQEPDVASHYHGRLKHLLVDEFQDTSEIQMRWLEDLAGPKASITAVGDDDQAIYGWRGASSANMLGFSQQNNCKVVRLEQNYRSTQTILEAANAVIKHSSKRLGKELWTDQATGAPISLFVADTDWSEVRYVAQQIENLIESAKSPCSPSDIAILYRARRQSRLVEHELRAHGIPFSVHGGRQFFDYEEIRDVIAYLRVISDSSTNVSTTRILNKPSRGIGSKAMEEIVFYAEANKMSYFDACRAIGNKMGARGQKLKGFVNLITRLRRRAVQCGLIAKPVAPPPQINEAEAMGNQVAPPLKAKRAGSLQTGDLFSADKFDASPATATQPSSQDEQESQSSDPTTSSMSLGDFIAEVIEQTGLKEHHGKGADGRAQSRLENLEELIVAGNNAHQLDGDLGEQVGSPLTEFLADSALSQEGENGDSAQQVNLMTMHAAKGLEFPIVFAIGMEEDTFPHKESIRMGTVDEERRLCYVTLTRAMQRLFLSMANHRSSSYGGQMGTRPSRFLQEIPEKLIEIDELSQDFSLPSQDHRGEFGAPVSGTGMAVGSRVAHHKFGCGTIVATQGKGENTTITVNFEQAGEKLLLLRLANLQKIDTA